MVDFVLNFEYNSILAITLYWAPLLLCALGYTHRTWANYQKDVHARAAAQTRGANGFYCPTDRIGDILGRALVSALPIANLWAACFDVAPRMFGKFFCWLSKVFNQPLVPPTDG